MKTIGISVYSLPM